MKRNKVVGLAGIVLSLAGAAGVYYTFSKPGSFLNYASKVTWRAATKNGYERSSYIDLIMRAWEGKKVYGDLTLDTPINFYWRDGYVIEYVDEGKGYRIIEEHPYTPKSQLRVFVNNIEARGLTKEQEALYKSQIDRCLASISRTCIFP